MADSLARPDPFITDAERASLVSGRQKDRDVAPIGIRILLDSPVLLLISYPGTITTTLYSRSSPLLPCEASKRILELPVVLVPALVFPTPQVSQYAFSCVGSRNAHLEWPGDTVTKEDMGEDPERARSNKQTRDNQASQPPHNCTTQPTCHQHYCHARSAQDRRNACSTQL